MTTLHEGMQAEIRALSRYQVPDLLKFVIEHCIRQQIFAKPVAQVVMEMEHQITSDMLDEGKVL